MSTAPASIQEVEASAMRLPADQRADLAERLWMSVSECETVTDVLSESQISEIVRRQQRHRSGDGGAIDFRHSLQLLDDAQAERNRS